ncbi:MAG: hypothetical protein QOI64_534 [Solirubrobacteraceae bacterium]|nr:hypothetical protein [Solirubrobacteraceae bacterium]
MTTFTAQTYQNEFLPEGATEVNAIVTVTATCSGARTAGSARAAVIVVVDTSGSMGTPGQNIKAAKAATSAAIDCIRDGAEFAVIAGTDVARRVYPIDRALAVAGSDTRAAARAATARLEASGGTAIGSWLRLAKRLFEGTAGTIRHAILLTDGQNQHESDEELRAALEECEGRFQCDCRGIGTDWEVRELRQIASTLLGSVDMIAGADDLVADFTAMMDAAMGKVAGDVALRLWTPQGAQVAFVKQVAPAILELTSRAVASGPLSADYPTGAWGDESRDYHVCVDVPGHPAGREMAAGRVSLVVGGEVVSQALIRAVWTDDRALSTRMSREVAHYTGQTELMEAIQEGLAARKAGDEENATFRLGRAVQLAAESGNTTKLELLAAIVDVEDAATGTIRLKRDVAEGDEMMLDTRSSKTLRVTPAGDP